MATAILYARQSSRDLAKKNLSIPGQLDDCYEWCSKRGVEVLKEFTDPGRSGKTMENRPGLDAALEYVSENPVDFFVVRFHSRIDRSNEGWIWPLLELDLSQKGIKLIALDLQEGDDPEIRLSNDVVKSVSSYLMKKMQRDTMKAKITKMARGEILKTGKPPLGYKFQDTILEIIPEEAEIVRGMYRTLIEKGTIYWVVKYLEERGLKTKRGNPYRRTTVTKILKRTVYKGIYQYQDFEFSVPPIVDIETWTRANEILSGNTFTVASKALERHWELSGGVVKCGICGRNLSAVGRDIGGKTYHYYYCGNEKGVCSNNRYYRALETEMLGIRFLQDFYSDNSKFRDMIIKSLEQQFKKASRDNPEESKKNHLKQISKLDSEIERAQEGFIKSLVTEEQLRTTIQRNTKQKQIHELEIKKLSHLEDYNRKIQRIKETWKPLLETSVACKLGLYADQEEWIQVGEEEYEYIPPNYQWLQDGALFRREKYIELGIKVVCHPDGPFIEINEDRIFVGDETTSTARAV